MKRSRRRRRPGVAAVELAILLPILLTLLVGLWEVGRMVEVQQLLSNAAREGGRQASTTNLTAAQVQAAVVLYLTQNGIAGVTASNVTVSDLTSPGTDPTNSGQMDQLQVTVTIPFDSVRWVLVNQITSVKTLSATSTWYSMSDLPLSVNTTLPLN